MIYSLHDERKTSRQGPFCCDTLIVIILRPASWQGFVRAVSNQTGHPPSHTRPAMESLLETLCHSVEHCEIKAGVSFSNLFLPLSSALWIHFPKIQYRYQNIPCAKL